MLCFWIFRFHACLFVVVVVVVVVFVVVVVVVVVAVVVVVYQIRPKNQETSKIDVVPIINT